MSFKIKELFQGQQLTGFDCSTVEIKDLSGRNKEFTICVSSDKVDRMKDIILQEGINWSEWNQNPMMPWAHNYSKPSVAQGISKPWMEKYGGTTKTYVRGRMGSHTDALQIWDAMNEGLVRAASIGFIPVKTEPRKKDDEEGAPMFGAPTKYIEVTALEASICSIPANNDCLLAMKSMVQKGQLPSYCIGSDCEIDSLLRAEGISPDVIQGMVQRVIKRLDYEAALERVARLIEDEEEMDIEIEDDDEFEFDEFDGEEGDKLIDTGDGDMMTENELKGVITEALNEVLGRLD